MDDKVDGCWNMTSDEIPEKRPIIRVNDKFKFKCIRCDLCCGTGPNVTLTIFDVIRLSYYLDLNPHVFMRLYTKVIVGDLMPFVVLRGDAKGRCVFLGFDKEGKTFCKAYKYRPMKCRLFPLILVSPSSDRLEIDPGCPGVNHEEGEYIGVPIKLYKRYSTEVREHYMILFQKIMNEGKDAIEALDEAVEELRDRVKKKKQFWLDAGWLESLGTT